MDVSPHEGSVFPAYASNQNSLEHQWGALPSADALLKIAVAAAGNNDRLMVYANDQLDMQLTLTNMLTGAIANVSMR